MANTKKKPAKAKEPNAISVREIIISVTQYDNGTENIDISTEGDFKTSELIGLLEEIKVKAIVSNTF